LNVSVQASLNENLGGTIESLLMECPVVATRVGGMVDSVRDGETGVLVNPASSEDLARGILQLLRDPERARSLGRAGRRLMLEDFTLAATVRKLNALYIRCLQPGRDSPRKYRLWMSGCRLLMSLPIAAYLVTRWTIQTIVFRGVDAIRGAVDHAQ